MVLFSPVHARSANIYIGILAASGLCQEQSRGEQGLLALLNPSASGKRGMGKGGTSGDPAAADVDGARAGVPLLQLSISLTSVVTFAQPPPCPAHRVFIVQGSLNYNLGKKVSFLQQTAISEGSFQSIEGPSLLHGGTGYLCPAWWQLPAGDWQSPPARRDGVPHAARAAGKLELAMRSPPNLFLGSLFEDTLGKHFSPLKKSLELSFSLASPSLAGAGCYSPDLISICREMRAPTAARLHSQK